MSDVEKPLALFDIDNTIYPGLSYLQLLESLVDEGLVDREFQEQARAARTDHRENMMQYGNFVNRLVEIYAQGASGQLAADVQESADNFFTLNHHFFGYVQPTMKMLAPTREIVLVTGNVQFAANAVAKALGIQHRHHLSSELEVVRGIITGNVTTCLDDGNQKLQAINNQFDPRRLERSFGFGDSEGDLDMLKAVTYPICINPRPALALAAQRRGWPIIDGVDELNSKDGLTVVREILASE